MNAPSRSREGSKKRPYVKPAFEVHHRPLPPDPKNQTASQRVRATISRLVARFRDDPQERMRATIELAIEIIEFGRMRSNGRDDFLVEVPQIAFHFRETPHHVRQSLRLLEMKGIAEPTDSEDYWTLIA